LHPRLHGCNSLLHTEEVITQRRRVARAYQKANKIGADVTITLMRGLFCVVAGIGVGVGCRRWRSPSPSPIRRSLYLSS
jgi:hypothetical protein